MPRDFPRSRRIEDQIQRVLSDVIRGDLRDPRLSDVFITAVRVSRDLSVAWVHYSVIQGDAASDDIAEALRGAMGFIRSRLAKVLTVRRVPELRFEADDTAVKADAMDRLIGSAIQRDEEQHEDSPDPDAGPTDADH